MSREETSDTTGLREVERCPSCGHQPHERLGFCPNLASDNDCSCKFAAHPTPDASPDPAVVTPDAGDVEALAEVLLAVDVPPAERAGMPFPASAYLIEGNGCDFSRAILASDWLANHVAAAREADRAEVWDEGYRVGREDERTKGQFIRFTEDNPYRQDPS